MDADVADVVAMGEGPAVAVAAGSAGNCPSVH